jgi:hypothetical protein
MASNQGRRQHEQIGEIQPQPPKASVPRPAGGEVCCPVDGYPARRLEGTLFKFSYRHAGRVWDCGSDAMVLTTQEMLDAIPGVAW